MNVTLDSVPRPKGAAQASRLGQDFVVLDAAGQMLRGLNATGARIWELMDGNKSIHDIAKMLALEFQKPEAVVAQDVLSFVNLLCTKGLVDVARLPHKG